ncbi:MAG: chorismate synthase [Oscillospiraceae bacterium]|nr:chorismate synthase [Oscillospiraceae bacterium]MDY2848533.1 chorismate synthase [Oscillospiraceae bacterium]
MSSFWNHNISISVFGESHGPAIGVVIDNLPPGEPLDVDAIREFMARRAPKSDGTTTSRRETDMPNIMSGYLNGRTTGTPLAAFINNTDTHSQDYGNISRLARPGHADYTGALRYRGFNDVRGGGHFSGRLTAPIVFAGAVCGQILERRGIYTGTHIAQVHNIKDTMFNPCNIDRDLIINLRHKIFPAISDKKGQRMRDDILLARQSLDSVGGVVECAVTNVPAGIGSPMFDGLENTISSLVFGIPAVKGIEFGAGFEAAKMLGSQNNDEFYVDERGHVLTKTNNHGGILGGISSGMPIIFRVAFKPTPSIAQPQETIDYSAMTNETLVIKGRHDPCVAVRAVPVVEAAANIAVLSHMLDYPNF